MDFKNLKIHEDPHARSLTYTGIIALFISKYVTG